MENCLRLILFVPLFLYIVGFRFRVWNFLRDVPIKVFFEFNVNEMQVDSVVRQTESRVDRLC